MSLRARIALAAAVAVAGVTVLLGAISYLSTRTQLTNQIRGQLHQLAAPYVRAHPGDHGQSPGTVTASDRGAAACVPQQAVHHEGPQLGGAPGYFQSVCPGGRAVADLGGTPELPVTAAVRSIAQRARGSLYFDAIVKHVHVEILAIGDPPDHKAIEVALPLTAIDATLNHLLSTSLLLAAISVLLAGAAGLLIARTAVAPILRFSANTEKSTSSLEHPQRLEESGAGELRRLAISFNRTLDALERSLQSQRHLIADASHELRTPIAALRSNIQIFLEAHRLPEHERRDLQQTIIAELDDLTQLVADVIDLARGVTPSDHIESVELDELVREAVERAKRRAPSLRFDLDLEPTTIQNSPERVSRALTNLLDNARKWSPEGGAIAVALQDGVVTVRDHGPGFEEQDLPHVFDRFYRSAQARRKPGSGLGLAIVKQAAEARGGSAQAANAPSGGALLSVAFGPSQPDEGSLNSSEPSPAAGHR
jgi:two-component system, OmpR family, sensor histidine kinase MprB